MAGFGLSVNHESLIPADYKNAPEIRTGLDTTNIDKIVAHTWGPGTTALDTRYITPADFRGEAAKMLGGTTIVPDGADPKVGIDGKKINGREFIDPKDIVVNDKMNPDTLSPGKKKEFEHVADEYARLEKDYGHQRALEYLAQQINMMGARPDSPGLQGVQLNWTIGVLSEVMRRKGIAFPVGEISVEEVPVRQ